MTDLRGQIQAALHTHRRQHESSMYCECGVWADNMDTHRTDTVTRLVQPELDRRDKAAAALEAERDRFAQLAEDRADRIADLIADRARLRTRLAEQEAETMRQHERARDAEAAIARVRALAERLEEFAENALKEPDRQLYAAIARDLHSRIDGSPSGPAATQTTDDTADRCPHGCDVSRCPCLACEADTPDTPDTNLPQEQP
ncbi:hypothetical protein [Streptomyces sp. NPDC002758]